MGTVANAGMVLAYIWSNSEHMPATILGPSTRGDDFFRVSFMRNGHELEHHVPLGRLLFQIRSPSAEPSDASPTRGLLAFWYRTSHARMGLSKHGTLSDRRFPDVCLLAQGCIYGGFRAGGGGVFCPLAGISTFWPCNPPLEIPPTGGTVTLPGKHRKY